jgi:hypothetical protein
MHAPTPETPGRLTQHTRASTQGSFRSEVQMTVREHDHGPGTPTSSWLFLDCTMFVFRLVLYFSRSHASISVTQLLDRQELAAVIQEETYHSDGTLNDGDEA